MQSASQTLFHTDPSDLSVSNAALLAGMVKAPSYHSPLKHPDRALKRRNEVIDAMNSQHTISSAEAETAKTAPLGLAVTQNKTERILRNEFIRSQR